LTRTHITRRSTKRDALDGAGAGAGDELALLAVVAHYHSPLKAPGVLLCLDDDQSLDVGRGAKTAVSTKPDGTLRLDLADEWVSQAHATIQRRRIKDLGSRNGTRVNGLPAEGGRLADGDLLEVGHTLLCFRKLPAEAARELATVAESLQGTVMLTLSPKLLEELERARRVAKSRLPIVVTGETGAGKEVVARAIHEWSGRSGPFVAVNCAAIPTGLAESELFGHRRGSFSGAHEDRRGLAEAAERGTLFLDEVDALPAELQPKLLRFLQDGAFRRIGESDERTTDARVLSASNRDLNEAVSSGAMREDLHARLCGLVVWIPPLRDRREDLGLLVARLLERHAESRASQMEIRPDAWRTLVRRRWPANVRELERCIQAAILLAKDGKVIGPDHVRERQVDTAEEEPAVAAKPKRDIDRVRTELEAGLVKHQGNLAAVAREMGVSRMQVYRWTQRFGLNPETYRTPPP